jgi:hypothetical protein
MLRNGNNLKQKWGDCEDQEMVAGWNGVAGIGITFRRSLLGSGDADHPDRLQERSPDRD